MINLIRRPWIKGSKESHKGDAAVTRRVESILMLGGEI